MCVEGYKLLTLKQLLREIEQEKELELIREFKRKVKNGKLTAKQIEAEYKKLEE